MKRLLFSRIDNSPLILFRMFFGALIAMESFGAIITGWVRRTLVEPEFTFSFIGFEWLQPLPGLGMYFYFALMGCFGLAVMVGYRYRWSMLFFTLMWTAVYLMQKTSYNNHYYLLVLVSAMMCLLPAANARSMDAKRRPEAQTHWMYSWVKWLIVGQLLIVYTYAAIAKLYTDWLDFSFIELLMANRAHYPILGDFLQKSWVHQGIGLFGIFFDFLVIPMLLWKPTRKWALAASVFFHLFNSIVLQIGIFPYLALAFTVFFFEPETIRGRFFPSKPIPEQTGVVPPGNAGLKTGAIGVYLLIQLLLPLRHHAIPGDVLWTEEGHRLSWRMMLRSRRGMTQFKVVDKETGSEMQVRLDEFLSPKQQGRVVSYPDFMWQFAQRLKTHYAEMGRDVSVYVDSRVRVNRRPFRRFIDPEVDLASVPWEHLKHHTWILPYHPEERQNP